MRTFTKEQVAVGLAWFKTQPQDKYGGGPDGFPDTTCTQGGYEQVAGFIATALAEGHAAGLEEAASKVVSAANAMGAACARTLGDASKYEYAQDRLMEAHAEIRALKEKA